MLNVELIDLQNRRCSDYGNNGSEGIQQLHISDVEPLTRHEERLSPYMKTDRVGYEDCSYRCKVKNELRS